MSEAEYVKHVEDALLKWWESKRPTFFSVKDFMGTPDIDREGEDAELAQVAAEVAAKRLFSGDSGSKS